MNRQEYLSKLLMTCWNIDKLRGRTILSAIALRLLGERPAEDVCGDPLPKMQLVGDVAVIPISGLICCDVPSWLKEIGLNLTDANDIEEEIEEALEDENVTTIVFDVDSPGGWSLAGDKLFDLVDSANKVKPVMAFCGDGRDMCSSAYEAVAGASVIYCSKYAMAVGCIGTYLAYFDDTDFWSRLGIKWEVFKSGEIKGIGESVPLTEQQKAFLQSSVNEFGNRFRKNVMKYRTAISPDDMQGQYYGGIEAARRSFVAANVPDLQTAIARFRKLVRKAA